MADIMERRKAVFRRLLKFFQPGTCVDLGTGHGLFAIEAANIGWKVTGVDARSERFPSDSRIVWERRDIRKVDLRRFDVILCLGLFYHLSLKDQLDLLKRCGGKPVILDTHVDEGSHDHKLSARVQDQGYKGRLYREPGLTTSSWGNTQSFWPTKESLYLMLGNVGYDVILAVEPWITNDRTFFLAASSNQ